MNNPDDRFPRDPRHPESLQALLGYAVANARRTARELLSNAKSVEDRARILRNLPADLAAHITEGYHHDQTETARHDPGPIQLDFGIY